MTGIGLILTAAALLAGSGLPGLLGSRRAGWSERVAAAMTVLAALMGLMGVLLPDEPGLAHLEAAWGLPWGGFAVSLDSISRAFLLPLFLMPALGAVYGLGYWKQSDHPANARKLRVFYGMMPAAMVMLLIVRDGVLFLLAWEVMALSAFFLVTTEDDDAASRLAGWVYFVATHVGTLSLFAMFALVRSATGSFGFGSIAATHLPPSVATAIFVLALVGFGLKAGLMPLHVWLPGAHANAPSHVSAMLSGIMLKMGIYGLIRMTALLPVPPIWWGATVLTLGAVSALAGLAFAIAQHDLKRLLAYSSIENIGIIATGLGLALLGRSAGQPAWAALGLGGAILHIWNHSLFKPLLFFGAGSILHGARTRRIDELGGLARRMPRTAALFLVGSIAICALPPLNGFVSELLIYLGLFGTLGTSGGPQWPAAAAVVPVLGLAGGLAAVAFTKLFGMVFLGEARTDSARHAHESPGTMLVPMAILASLCILLGVFPAAAAPLIDKAVAAWWPAGGAGAPSVLSVAPLGALSIVSLVLLAGSAVGVAALRRAMTPGSSERPGTWGCGYAAPGPRMQYTGSSFSQFAVSLFAWILLPRTRRTRIRGFFPAAGRFRTEVPDVVLDRALLPAVRWTAHFFRWARLLQQGQIQVYVLYILLIVLVLFVSAYVF